MSTLMWILIIGVTLAGAAFAVALAALRHWVAFTLFLIAYVAGVVTAAVQAVLTT
jgi:hypothetical protein